MPRVPTVSLVVWLLTGCGAPSAPPPRAPEPTPCATRAEPSATPAIHPDCDWDHGGTGGRPECPNTGQAPPPFVVQNPACDDGDGAARLLGSGPATPLAIVREGRIEAARQPCCAPWATDRGRVWHALDGYGRSRGTVRVAGGEGYDVTGCFELSLSGSAGTFDRGRPPEGFDSANVWGFASPWAEPRLDSRWTPTPSELRALEAWVGTLDPSVIESAPSQGSPALPLAQRLATFQEEDTMVGDGRGEQLRYAVVGGRYLLVARHVGSRRFVVSHLDTRMTNEGHATSRTYLPAATFDLNGDGRAEIVVRWNEAGAWGLRVLERAEGARDTWREVAEDLGGATI